tara:strand:- start:37 stop:441 length:405 start_codon:yes stop_codon:yes gene_type:complete
MSDKDITITFDLAEWKKLYSSLTVNLPINMMRAPSIGRNRARYDALVDNLEPAMIQIGELEKNPISFYLVDDAGGFDKVSLEKVIEEFNAMITYITQHSLTVTDHLKLTTDKHEAMTLANTPFKMSEKTIGDAN